MSDARRESCHNPAAIEVEGLGSRIEGRWILRGLDLRLMRGETLALIGRSGGGKSLLTRHIIALNKPVEGQITVLGAHMGRLDEREQRLLSRRWGVLFQQGALFSALNVFDNIGFPMRELRRDGLDVPEDLVADLVAVKLAAVGLDPDVGNRMPDELSGGMVKRAALARALALDPELLFLDEPTAGLDPAAARDFHHLYGELHKEIGLSGLIVTHNRATLEALADRVAVLLDGKIMTVGPLSQVRQMPHPFIERFFAGDASSEADEN